VARAVALTAVDINPTLTTVARSIRHHDEQLAQLFSQFALFSSLGELLWGRGGRKILQMRISETTGAGVVLQITCPSNQQQQTSEGQRHNQHSITTL